MKVYLSENLKHLRQTNNLTQEKLAEFLGVTFQSISNWERGESLPDITMLPEIASFFKTSIDNLLGMNKTEAEKKIKEYLTLYENMRYKDTSFVFSKFECAKNEFPQNFNILVRYMELLMCEKTTCNNSEYNKMSDELINIYENIQQHCTDDNIRMWSKRLICQHFHTKAHYTGNEYFQEKAEEILCEMPDMLNSKDYLSTMLITDKEKHHFACCTAIENTLYLLNNSVSHYYIYDDNFSYEYRIEAIKKLIDIADIIYTDGNYGKLWLNTIYNYGHLGYLYFNSGDEEKSLKYLKNSVELAIKYDELPEKSLRTAQYFDGMIYEKIPHGKTMLERMKYLITSKYPLSSEFKNSEKFSEIRNLLK